ncbi:hypothetical protein FQA39_LY08972 [Lamprigera yunnana]|nr:hypothetical protein FQA39_LY08972 [Lamprigera yunnana]
MVAAFADWAYLVEADAVALLVIAALPGDFLEAATAAATFTDLARLVEDGVDAVTALADLKNALKSERIGQGNCTYSGLSTISGTRYDPIHHNTTTFNHEETMINPFTIITFTCTRKSTNTQTPFDNPICFVYVAVASVTVPIPVEPEKCVDSPMDDSVSRDAEKMKIDE